MDNTGTATDVQLPYVVYASHGMGADSLSAYVKVTLYVVYTNKNI